MNRRTLQTGAAATGAVAVAGGGGFVQWASQGAGAWQAATNDLRRPFDPSGGTAELVRYATLAANSHNTQPWRFVVAGRSIVIHPDFARRTPVVDPDDHHLFASLGCAAETIVQTAPLAGLSASVAFDAGGEGVVVDLASGPVTATERAAAIPHRQCTRSVYDGRAVPADALRALEAAGAGEGVHVRLFTERRSIDDILAFIVDGNTQQIDDPAFVAELKEWIRFSYRAALTTADGLFAKCSGNPVLPGFVGPLLFGLVFSAGAENPKIVEQVGSSSGIAVFVSDKDDKAHWVEAGRAYQRFALQATALGIRHAFLNQPVEVAEVRHRFAGHLGLGGGRPDLVVRFGYGPEMPMSLRRPVADVLVA